MGNRFSDHNRRLFNRFIKISMLGMVFIFLSIWFVTACGKLGEETQKPTGAVVSPQVVSPRVEENTKTPLDLSTAIERVAEQNIPAVVHIEVTERQEVVNPLSPFEDDPFFQRFFNIPKMPRKFKRELKGLGTGMIIDQKGYILTNNHVVRGATKIQALLASGKRYPAKLVGADPKTDLAVIQISAKESLPHVTFGDSDKVKVGQWVVAIGHPRGFDQSVTQGIISAKHRTGITDPSSYQDFLQTDAAINPGNSGGPLLNLWGEVIGVNAVIVSQSGGYEGIGFAIPSNMALHISKALIAHSKVERGWLGVSIQDITPELAKSFGVESTKGALVAEVIKGGPAEKAGIKRGDIVVSYGGKEIKSAGILRNEVAIGPIDQNVEVAVLRNDKKVKFIVKTGNMEGATKILSSSVKDRLGVKVRPVMPREAEKYGISLQNGVVIAWLDTKGPLKQAGFEVEDIILEINGQPIESMESFIGLVNALKPRQKIAILALDHRSGDTGYNIQVVVR